MSKLQVNDIVNKDDDGSVGFSKGAVVTGVVTATSFVGSGEGLTGVASTDNIITSTASTFANINSTGIVTAVSFSGDGSGLSGVGGQLDITSSLFT